MDSSDRADWRNAEILTGDHWRLFFRARHQHYTNLIARPRTLVRPPLSSICLFSGGLDSFVGAVDLLAAGQTPLFVSHYWDLSTSSQTRCAQRLGVTYGDLPPRHVRARVGFGRNDFSHEMATEPTTRGRSFLFFALATLAASGLDGTPTLYVPENGPHLFERATRPPAHRCLEHTDDAPLLYGPLAGSFQTAWHRRQSRKPVPF